ncbi:unnamed protein product [Caenorhabditis angaria]|uniref:C-type lectin domain-containing protein n=1 Tax=Caenorhabditis angaria TaxID=860376 RepID=A0A9P1IR26_9PELO|nr:unnamed protein product [Caenorhabditis angaria]
MSKIFFLLATLRFATACADVCNEDDGAYVMSTFPNVAPVPTCSEGYKSFPRPGYNWCMKIYPAILKNFTEAEALCTADGAVPSGHQNDVEESWITRTAITVQAEYGYTIGGVWLGLHITLGCDYTGFADDSPNCGTNSFEWTDGYTTGSSQIKWAEGEPWQSNAYQCALMAAYSAGNFPDNDFEALPTQVINVACNTRYASRPFQTRTTIVCGKPPTEYS